MIHLEILELLQWLHIVVMLCWLFFISFLRSRDNGELKINVTTDRNKTLSVFLFFKSFLIPLKDIKDDVMITNGNSVLIFHSWDIFLFLMWQDLRNHLHSLSISEFCLWISILKDYLCQYQSIISANAFFKDHTQKTQRWIKTHTKKNQMKL